MTHRVVVLTQQFVFGESGNRNEIRVRVGDGALKVGGGQNVRRFSNRNFTAADGQVEAHRQIFLGEMGLNTQGNRRHRSIGALA